MEQLTRLLASLNSKQKISIGVMAAVVIAALYAFSNWHREQDFKPLYTGIAPEEAAAIVQKIKESGSDYRLSDTGGVISVPSGKVAELRLEMAAAGLPKSGRIGFEIFDKANFGATDFVEHVNYNRALEGELERSIDSLSAVEHSRVHLTPPKDSVFVESREPGKASVLVGLRAGAALFPRNVVAIQQLISSAVEGVTADDVSVVDTNNGTLLSRRKPTDGDGSDAGYSYRERLEHDMMEKINSTLEPVLGRDRFRAGVSVDCDLNSAEQDEETYDPTKSVMVNSQKTEEVQAGGATAGIPGTASNLPRPPARAGGPTNTNNRRTENITYESSRVVRKTHIPQGQIKRVSVSVLLQEKSHWEGKGKTRKLVPVPTSAETIKAVHDLVAGITGFTQERGDQITVESLPFENTSDDEQLGPAPTASEPFSWKSALHNRTYQIGGGVALLLIGGFAFLLMRGGSKKTVQMAAAVEGGATAPQLEESKTALAKSAGESAPARTEADAVDGGEAESADQAKSDSAVLAKLKLPKVDGRKAELLVAEIRKIAKKDPTHSAQVIQTWLHEK